MPGFFHAGLDLGQMSDPSALAIVESIEPPVPPDPPTSDLQRWGKLTGKDPAAVAAAFREGHKLIKQKPPIVLHCRHLERVKLRTPYPDIVKDITERLNKAPLKGNCELVLDATGVGTPVYDMFVKAKLRPVGIWIHGGNEVNEDHVYRRYKVPKRDLVVTLQSLMQEGRMRIASQLPEAETLKTELTNFKVKVDKKTAHDSYNAREGQHDDLILALAIAAWRAVRRMSYRISFG